MRLELADELLVLLAALGLFAAVPIAYLVLVVLHELVKPVLVGDGTTQHMAAMIWAVARPATTEDDTG